MFPIFANNWRVWCNKDAAKKLYTNNVNPVFPSVSFSRYMQRLFCFYLFPVKFINVKTHTFLHPTLQLPSNLYCVWPSKLLFQQTHTEKKSNILRNTIPSEHPNSVFIQIQLLFWHTNQSDETNLIRTSMMLAKWRKPGKVHVSVHMCVPTYVICHVNQGSLYLLANTYQDISSFSIR